MPMVTDARFVRHRFDELFEIDHERKESFRNKYHSLFHVHEPTPSQGAEPGPIRVHTTPEGTKIVTVVFSTQLGGQGEDVEQRLQEIRQMLVDLLEPGERCRLYVDHESDEHDDVFVRVARGYVAPPDSSEAL